jgi:hypothetical protein
MPFGRLALVVSFVVVVVALISVASPAVAGADTQDGTADETEGEMMMMRTVALRRNTVTVSPFLGLMGFARVNVADFGVGYERTIGEHHGFYIESTAVHVHGDPTHVTLFGGGVGYRWHRSLTRSAPFVGVMAIAHVGRGRMDLETGSEHVDVTSIGGVAQIGYVWRWDRWVFATRIGAGYGRYMVTSDNDVEAVEESIRDVLAYVPVELDAELSIGLRF